MLEIEGLSYETTKHLIVDVETLGINPPAPILTIGMVFLDFDPYREGAENGEPDIKTYYFGVDQKECVGEADEATLAWWGQQDCAVRKAAFCPTVTPNVFQEFVNIVNREAPDYLWGNSPDFDFGHLGAQIKAKGLELPWRFWQLRDIRTLKGLGLSTDACVMKVANSDALPSFARHHALYDALREAQILKLTIQRLSSLMNGGASRN